jgi:hypothetical protein
VPAEHEGNAQGSDEGAETVGELIAELVGRALVEKDGTERKVRVSTVAQIRLVNFLCRMAKGANGADKVETGTRSGSERRTAGSSTGSQIVTNEATRRLSDHSPLVLDLAQR